MDKYKRENEDDYSLKCQTKICKIESNNWLDILNKNTPKNSDLKESKMKGEMPKEGRSKKDEYKKINEDDYSLDKQTTIC